MMGYGLWVMGTTSAYAREGTYEHEGQVRIPHSRLFFKLHFKSQKHFFLFGHFFSKLHCVFLFAFQMFYWAGCFDFICCDKYLGVLDL